MMISEVRTGVRPRALGLSGQIRPDRLDINRDDASEALIPRPGSKAALLNSLVPGASTSQVVQDLSLFPSPILGLLDRFGIKVAVLQDGQTLADSPALRHTPAADYPGRCQQAHSMMEQALDCIPPAVEGDAASTNAYARSLGKLADWLPQGLCEAGLDFRVGLAYQPFTLEKLAEQRAVPPENLQDWRAAFSALNHNLVDGLEGDQLQARHGLFLLPFNYHQGQPIPENRLRDAKETTAEFVERSLGLNRPEDKLVLLHEKFLADPAPEVGHYRVAVHEVGHALDHALEGLIQVPGLGAAHRQTVDSLFQADEARAAQGQIVFTSGRAKDDVREYFAEAVEAYLTEPRADGQDFYNGDNHRDCLRERNPVLFNYVDKIFHTDFAADLVPSTPRPRPLPPGIPDPDHGLVEIS